VLTKTDPVRPFVSSPDDQIMPPSVLTLGRPSRLKEMGSPWTWSEGTTLKPFPCWLWRHYLQAQGSTTGLRRIHLTWTFWVHGRGFQLQFPLF